MEELKASVAALGADLTTVRKEGAVTRAALNKHIQESNAQSKQTAAAIADLGGRIADLARAVEGIAPAIHDFREFAAILNGAKSVARWIAITCVGAWITLMATTIYTHFATANKVQATAQALASKTTAVEESAAADRDAKITALSNKLDTLSGQIGNTTAVAKGHK